MNDLIIKLRQIELKFVEVIELNHRLVLMLHLNLNQTRPRGKENDKK